MPILGVVEAIHNKEARLEDFPELPESVRNRVIKILDGMVKAASEEDHNPGLIDVSRSEMEAMIREGEGIFNRICSEKFDGNFGWIEAKKKYWNPRKLDIFKNHKNYNIILDWIEKKHERHVPRKSEYSPEFEKILWKIKHLPLAEERYNNDLRSMEAGESQE